jgi:putative phosphoribosyl transferase
MPFASNFVSNHNGDAGMLFRDRTDAGQRLGTYLKEFVHENAVVLALPRGGVPVAFEVARMLRAPLDVFVVRKLGTPGQEELAMGAIASGGVRVLNREVVQALEIPQQQIDAVAAREMSELERREREYRGNRDPIDVRGLTAILVDDGLATGSTMRAAVAALRQLRPEKVLVAVPVAARTTCADLREDGDEVLCLYTPMDFFAVGQWYGDFSQTTDEEVRELLHRAAAKPVQGSFEKTAEGVHRETGH